MISKRNQAREHFVKKRAFYVFLSIFLLYIVFLFEIPEKLSLKRANVGERVTLLLGKEEKKNDLSEWRVPNVTDIPVKKAIIKLIPYTQNIKVYGSGYVIKQYPKPFEVIRGDTQCILYAGARR